MANEVRVESESNMTARKLLDNGKVDKNDGKSRFEQYEMILEDLKEEYGGRLDSRQLKYIAALSVTGKKTLSQQIAGISQFLTSKWRNGGKNKYDMEFAGLFRKLEEWANDLYDDLLLNEVDRRAVEGVKEDVYYQGEKIGEKMKYSDSLLMFRVKGRLPEYRESGGISINGGSGGEVNISFELPDMNADIIDGETLEESD